MAVTIDRQELNKFNRQIKEFSNQFGEKQIGILFRRQVGRFPLKEARAILATETHGTGALERKGLLVAKEANSRGEASFILGGGRAEKYEHGYIAHWVELGTSGIVRDGGVRYKSGQRYASPRAGINFLERAAKRSERPLFEATVKGMDKKFKKLGK